MATGGLRAPGFQVTPSCRPMLDAGRCPRGAQSSESGETRAHCSLGGKAAGLTGGGGGLGGRRHKGLQTPVAPKSPLTSKERPNHAWPGGRGGAGSESPWALQTPGNPAAPGPEQVAQVLCASVSPFLRGECGEAFPTPHRTVSVIPALAVAQDRRSAPVGHGHHSECPGRRVCLLAHQFDKHFPGSSCVQGRDGPCSLLSGSNMSMLEED